MSDGHQCIEEVTTDRRVQWLEPTDSTKGRFHYTVWGKVRNKSCLLNTTVANPTTKLLHPYAYTSMGLLIC